jgi:hypothetical protein
MINRKPKKLGQRGQVMVLGVVTLVVLAFMTMLSFNVGNAVTQKIRLQSHSDAMAYSIAVTEARAFNYYAYSNRAIAAVLVAQASLHSWHSIATTAGPIMNAGMFAFFEVAAVEFALCCSCPWCACVWHCIDAVQAILVALKYMKEIKTWNNKVKGLEGAFNNAVRLLGGVNDMIHNSQLVMGVDMVARFLTGNTQGGGEYEQIRLKNNKCAEDFPIAVTTMNVFKYSCALEGAATDPLCIGGVPGAVARTTKVPRRKVITNAANAALPTFDTGRNGTGLLYVGLSVIQKAQQIPGSGINTPTLHRGGGRITNGSQYTQCQGYSKNNTEGTTACGWDEGLFTSVGWRHGAGAFPYGGFVASNRQGGRHQAGPDWLTTLQIINKAYHSGQHDRFRATQWEESDNPVDGLECLTPAAYQANCFINFRANSGNSPYQQQPTVYASSKVNLKTLRDNCATKAQPWEMNSSGKVTINDGERGSSTLTFVPQNDAYAISKAMVYFHRFDSTNSQGGWKAAPNMFDPYWRAKLHPIDNQIEAGLLMGAAGDTANLAALAGPYEGKYP